MKYLSFFSGPGSCALASRDLGWECVAFSEIDPHASAVLAYRFPVVPNVGDILAHDWSQYRGQVDAVVGGPPCQAFSVAGLRGSLDDHRGNLSLEYIRAIDAIQPRFTITENVPGWLSTNDNAFGCFLGALAGHDAPLVPGRGQRWTNAGLVVGPRRMVAWRILDAQHYGVPQRRRRVFVVSSNIGERPTSEEILFIEQGVRGNPPTRGTAREGSAGGIREGVAGSLGGGTGERGWCNDLDRSGAFIPEIAANWPAELAPTLNAHFGDKQGLKDQHALNGAGLFVPMGSDSDTKPGHLIPMLADPISYMADDYRNGSYAETETARPLTTSADRSRSAPVVAFNCKRDGADADEIAPTLLSMPHDESHANGGDQDTLVFAQAVDTFHQAIVGEQTQSLKSNIRGGGDSVPCVLEQAVAFAENQRGELRTSDIAPQLTTGGGKQGEGYSAVYFETRVARNGHGAPNPLAAALRSEAGQGDSAPCVITGFQSSQSGVREVETHATLDANNGSRRQNGVVAASQVRRLTPVECARLQSVPDTWLDIPYNGKPLSDSAKYRLLGNSWCINVVKWIFERLDAVDQQAREAHERTETP